MDDSSMNKTIHEFLGHCVHKNVSRNPAMPLDMDCADCGKTLTQKEYQAEKEGCRHSEKEPKYGKVRVCKFCGADDVSFDLGIPRLPDYITDLNAVREAELKVIEKFGRDVYFTALCKAFTETAEMSFIVTADAKTRAAAVMDVIDKEG